MWKDLAASFSLANLCYLEVWKRLLSSPPSPMAAMRTPPAPPEYAAALLNVTLLALAAWAALTLVRRAIRELARRRAKPLPRPLRSTATAIVGVLLVLSPFVAMTFGRSMWRIATYQPPPWSFTAEAEARPAESPRARIVWVIFDEWDYRLTFEDRPGWLNLPELQRFEKQAFFAEQAFPPSEHTAISMTSLLLGRVPAAADPAGLDNLWVSFPGEEKPTLWSEHPNLVTKVRAAGFRTAVVGWFMPYCPLLSGSADVCWWHDWTERARLGRRDVRWLMSNQWQTLVRSVRLHATKQSVPAVGHSQLYGQILPPALECAADASLGFVLLHLPIPHGPHFYDSSTGAVSWRVPQTTGYFDSLALLDLTLGQIREAMTEAGVWDSTTVILSSDHWLRTAEEIDGRRDYRVPFLLKLAGQRKPLRYTERFNTVVVHELTLALVSGKLRRPEQVALWLDRHRSEPPFPPGP